jgi:hypothetical protein
VNGGEDDSGLLTLSRFGMYLYDPEPEIGMATTLGNAVSNPSRIRIRRGGWGGLRSGPRRVMG